MRILFLAQHQIPHIGGVEKHLSNVSRYLQRSGIKINTISAENIKYPKIKYLGLFYIWSWFFKNRRLIENADLIHCHDVFVWYLPFKLLYLHKRVYTTFHGWEEIYPIPKKNIYLKILANKLSNGSIAVGKFIEKYYSIKANVITYGAATAIHSTVAKQKNTIVYVGRLEENTGLLKFLKWLDENPKYKVEFCGDGRLRTECEKYGKVYGFTDPIQYLKKAEYCVPGGYLAALEGLSANCKLKLFWNNKVKEDYWKMSPFFKLKGNKLKKWAKEQTWEKLADEYLKLYNSNQK